jgi:hypothetical protein
VFDACYRFGHDAHRWIRTILNETIVFIRTMRGVLTRPAPNLIACQPTRQRAAVVSRGATRSASEGPIGPTIKQAFLMLAEGRSGQDKLLAGSLPTSGPWTG